MNETPLHEPLIAEEGKEKERVFTGTPERIVNICLASISALIIYWTVYVSADVMWKHGLYIMTVFCMTLVIYPFEKKPKVNHVSLVDWLLIIGSIAGSAYAIWEYLDRFMRLGMLTEMDIFFGCLMLFLGLEVGRRVIGWSLTLVSIVLILYSLYGFVIPGHFGHGGFDLEAVVTQVNPEPGISSSVWPSRSPAIPWADRPRPPSSAARSSAPSPAAPWPTSLPPAC